MRSRQQKKTSSFFRNARGQSLAFLFLCVFLCAFLLTGCGKKETPEQQSTAPATEGISVVQAPDEGSSAAPEAATEPDQEKTPAERLQEDLEKGSIPWEDAPEIGDRDSLMDYLRLVRSYRITEAPVHFVDGCMVDYDEILKAVNLAYIDYEIHAQEEDTADVLYTLTYYPGERVATAYLSGDTSDLTDEELRLYDVAVMLVDAAEELPTPLLKELFLHDQIIGIVTYHNHKERVGVPRFCTALGAILDGQANCQGYCDAFEMLLTMAGFEVGKQSGYAGNEEHMWNTIRLDDQWYAVDCTWDDASFALNGTEYTSYAYFNAPLEILTATHSMEEYTVDHPIVRELADAKDYFFLTEEATDRFFGFYYPSMQELISDAAGRLEDGASYVYAMAPADKKNFKNYRAVTKELNRKLSSPLDYVTILTGAGEYSYVILDASGAKTAEDEGIQSEHAREDAGGGSDGQQPEAQEALIDEDGSYTTAEDVALYLHVYHRLPGNFITKKEARDLGWDGGGLEAYAPGKCIGGDRFGNYEGLLPEGGNYRECDIDTLGASGRGAKRLIYSDQGEIWYTEDHYATFTQLYP